MTVFPGTTSSFTNGVWTGNLTVSPVATGVVLRASDGSGHSGSSNAFNTVVLDLPVIMSPSTALAVVGQPFSYQILASAFPGSFNATGLPANLNVNTSTGLISGTPNSAGDSSINLAATNTVGTGNGILSVTVQGDGDGDGMGDAWESSYGLNPLNGSDAALDKDGDGESNLEEWISGTAPDDPSSRFAIIQQARTSSGIEITWNSIVGKRYRVLTRVSLVSGAWTSLTPNPIVAIGATTTWTHLNGQTASSGFYRVELVR